MHQRQPRRKRRRLALDDENDNHDTHTNNIDIHSNSSNNINQDTQQQQKLENNIDSLLAHPESKADEEGCSDNDSGSSSTGGQVNGNGAAKSDDDVLLISSDEEDGQQQQQQQQQQQGKRQEEQGAHNDDAGDQPAQKASKPAQLQQPLQQQQQQQQQDDSDTTLAGTEADEQLAAAAETNTGATSNRRITRRMAARAEKQHADITTPPPAAIRNVVFQSTQRADIMEQRLDASTRQVNELMLQLEKERATSQAALLEQATKSEHIQAKLRFLYEKEADHRKRIRAYETAAREQSNLQQRIQQLEAQLAESNDASERERQHMQRHIASLEHNVALREEAMQQQQTQADDGTAAAAAASAVNAGALATAHKTIESMHARIKALEAVQQEQRSGKEEQRSIDVQQQGEQQKRQQDALLESYRSELVALRKQTDDLETTRAALRAAQLEVANAQSLREEVDAERSRVARLQTAVQEHEAVKQRLVETERMLEEWKDAMGRILPEGMLDKKDIHADLAATTTASESVAWIGYVIHVIRRMREAEMVSTSRLAHLEAESKRWEAQAADHARKAEAASKQASVSDSALQSARVALQCAEQRVKLVSRECDSLKRILDSINDEDTLANHDIQRIARINELEALMEELRGSGNGGSSGVAAEKKRITVSGEIQTQNQSPQVLQQQGHQILHLRANPERAMQFALIQKLRQENEQLKLAQQEQQQQQMNVTAGPGALGLSFAAPSSPTTPALSAVVGAGDEKRIRALAEEMALKRIESFKKVFRGKVMEFREACYELFGWKLSLADDATYHLRSMYAEKAADVLTFRRQPDGVLQLLETPFCRQLDDASLGLLQKLHTIPGFMSQVTLDLFSKQTCL